MIFTVFGLFYVRLMGTVKLTGTPSLPVPVTFAIQRFVRVVQVAPVTVHVFLSDIDGFPTNSLFQTQDSTFSLLFLLNTLLKWLLLICKQIKNGLMVGESYMKRMPAHPSSIAGEDSEQFFNLLLNNHASCGNTHSRNVIVPSE